MIQKKLKIITVGPRESGKTIVTNSVCNSSQTHIGNSDKQYNPTVGCRILEYEANNGRTAVELWDCSGDQRYEHCWAAFVQGKHGVEAQYQRSGRLKHDAVDGVILMYNANEPTQANEVILWYEHFVQRCGISDFKCMIFAVNFDAKDVSSRNIKNRFQSGVRIPDKRLSGCTFHTISVRNDEESLRAVRAKFSLFVDQIAKESR